MFGKRIIFTGLLLTAFTGSAQVLPGFRVCGNVDEQQLVIENDPPDTRILINAPLKGFGRHDRVLLVFFALPNGNTIEQTFGKKLKAGDDWHYNIQHIGAQTRFLRKMLKHRTVVVAYLETRQKSWPAWKAVNPDFAVKAKKIVDDVKSVFSAWNPEVVLNGHSGGGRFIFSYLDGVGKIPEDVSKIAFLDSDYGYEDEPYGNQLLTWLRSGKKYLCTLAYNDSIVTYQGKPVVSATGGTWFRSRLMLRYLSQALPFKTRKADSLYWYSAWRGKAEIILHPNPEAKILHTVQVERNGFIQSMVSGTKAEQKGYVYFGKRAYESYIGDEVVLPVRKLNIPARESQAETGSRFMERIASLPKDVREEEIFKALSAGNLPGFLRNLVTLRAELPDAAGTLHTITCEVMPDYLSVGNDTDFCRIPMNPYTAQRLAGAFGGTLLTSAISDWIYNKAEVTLYPYNYLPVGDLNERTDKFRDHNLQIEKQFAEAGGKRGQLTAGTKKDVILSERLADQPGKVVIYGWHLPGGKPIQPAYSGHAAHYVDYSHGIRLMNNQVILDGRPVLLTDLLKDPLLFRLFSNEKEPMKQPFYKPAQ